MFDPEGPWLGRVREPTGVRIFDIGEDYVLGVRSDELGGERAHLHILEKSR